MISFIRRIRLCPGYKLYPQPNCFICVVVLDLYKYM